MLRPRLVAVVLIAWGAAPAGAVETHFDPDHGFRIKFPDRWETTNPSAVHALNGVAMKLTGQSINFTVCFVPRGRTSSELPRVLVQWQSWTEPPPSYEAIDEALARELPGALKRTESSLPIKLQSLESGGHFIDRDKNRIVMRLRATVPGSGTIDAVSFGMLGQKGTAIIHCYASKEQFPAALPLFEWFANSFRFDPGLEYKPDPNPKKESESLFGIASNFFGMGSSSSDSSASSSSPGASASGVNWEGAMNGGLRGAIIGGAIGGVAAAGHWLRKRMAA